MLTLLSNEPSGSFCDGLSRRSFLRMGGLGPGGLTFSQLLRGASQNDTRRSNKALIIVYLPGGPPHQDMFDIKTDAPSEIRGEFSEIATNVPGIRICELLPRMAKMADNLGINPNTTTVPDLTGRPHYLVDGAHQPMKEVV